MRKHIVYCFLWFCGSCRQQNRRRLAADISERGRYGRNFAGSKRGLDVPHHLDRWPLAQGVPLESLYVSVYNQPYEHNKLQQCKKISYVYLLQISTSTVSGVASINISAPQSEGRSSAEHNTGRIGPLIRHDRCHLCSHVLFCNDKMQNSLTNGQTEDHRFKLTAADTFRVINLWDITLLPYKIKWITWKYMVLELSLGYHISHKTQWQKDIIWYTYL